MKSIFIYHDEHVRTWLLSNSVLDDPLDLIVFGYRDWNYNRLKRAEVRVLPYLGEDAVGNWPRDRAAPIGQVHFRALLSQTVTKQGRLSHD